MTARPRTWRIARASRQGSKNQQRRQECQDHCVWATVPIAGSDTLVAAVADGLGSAPLSGRGARIATNVAVHQAALLVWREPQPVAPERLETILDLAVLSARRRIQQVAAREHEAPSQMATTLLLAIHTDNTMATAQIGDGAAVVSVQDGDFITFSKPERGEYANETHSLTSPRALQHCNIDIAVPQTPVSSIALMTDGMVSLTLAHPDQKPHEPFFEMMTEWLRQHRGRPHPNQQLGELLQSEKIRSKTDDDTTLLLAVRA